MFKPTSRLLCAALSAAALCSALTVSSRAQEIVVTASRMGDYEETVAVTPHVTLARRADNMIAAVEVICDTREANQRLEELKKTLQDMIATASADGTIALSVGSTILVDFNETMLDKVILPDGSRLETSRAVIIVKTAIRADDSFDAAAARITQFIAKTPKSGRTEILPSGGFNLSIVDPEKSRPELLSRIAEDARQTAGAFGQSYEVAVGGLQAPIEWYQSGQLELALYIRYDMLVKASQP